MNKDHSLELQTAILQAIVTTSLTEIGGVKAVHIHTPEVLDAVCMVMSGLVATAPEARTSDGLKRVIRRFARQLEQRVAEFKTHTAKHGSPFEVRD